MSVDYLHKPVTTANSVKKSSEYEDLVIKKCYLKNIQFSDETKNEPNHKAILKP